MKILLAVIACVVALPVFAAGDLAQCAKDPQTLGLRQRIENIRGQMDRIEAAADPAEQRRLLDLHAKTMQEGMRELRLRAPDSACRQEMMHAMMEQMLRHQVALQDTP